LLISIEIDTMAVDMTTLDVLACCRPLDAPALANDEAELTAALFGALADPARVKIVNALATSGVPVCACEFGPVLGLAQATVSHHLKRLTDVGLLEREQRGKWAYFSISPSAASRLAVLVRLPPDTGEVNR
jgi:ArsR family transcriptional regulator